MTLQTYLLLALALFSLGLFGLIGLPPTVGFIGKWFLFSAALERGQFYLVLFAALNATVGLYYYLQVIRQAFWAEPASEEILRPRPSVVVAALTSAFFAMAMGIFPGPFWDLTTRAVATLVH